MITVDIDLIQRNIALKLKRKRIECGLSQRNLAEFLGVTYQQVQKYEAGSNKIDVPKLVALSQKLGVPITYFFSEIDRIDTMPDKEIRESARLQKSFSRLPSKSRKTFLEVIESVAKSTN